MVTLRRNGSTRFRVESPNSPKNSVRAVIPSDTLALRWVDVIGPVDAGQAGSDEL